MSTTPLQERRIDIGGVLAKVFDIYGKTARTLLPLAVLLFLPVAIVSAIDGVIFQILGNVLQLIAGLWFAGVAVKAVQDVHEDGHLDATAGELLRSVTHVLWPLFLVGLVAGIAVGIGLILCIVPGLILVTIWAVAAPVVVLENPGVFAALGRSRELVRGNGWQVFGVLVAVIAISFVAVMVLGTIGAIGNSFFVLFIVLLIVSVALAPIQALVQGVLYFALKEAHGEQVLSTPTGVVQGFAPPVAPAVTPQESGTDAFGNPMVPPTPAVPPVLPEAQAPVAEPPAFAPPAAPSTGLQPPAADLPPAPGVPDVPASPTPEPPAATPFSDAPAEPQRPGERPGGSIPPPSAPDA